MKRSIHKLARVVHSEMSLRVFYYPEFDSIAFQARWGKYGALRHVTVQSIASAYYSHDIVRYSVENLAYRIAEKVLEDTK